MYAVVANGMCAICKTQEQLESVIAVYPYPKFKKVYTEEEGREWIRRHRRKRNEYEFERYGNTFSTGFVIVSYEITEECVRYEIDTKKCGYIRIQGGNDYAVEMRPEHLTVITNDTKLNDNLILHHVIAIRRILKILGPVVDVDVIIPDVSIYLALMKYTGTNYLIKGIQRDIENRAGGFSITIKQAQSEYVV